MQYQVVVFEPGKEGKVMMISTEDFSGILGGSYEYTSNKHGLDFTEVIVNQEGVLLDLPYNRGYFGTFIVMGVKDECPASLSEEELEEVKKTLDNKPNFSSKNSSYLVTFFEEKELKSEIFFYSEGYNHATLSNYDVIDAVLNTEDKVVLKQIEDTIRKIDFLNGDINHLLKHLGEGIAQNIFAQSKEFDLFN